MKTPFAFLSAAVIASLCLAASAADKKSGMSAGDEKFIKKTAASGLTEVKLAELGVQKATSPKVKELAQMLVTDHAVINENLKMLAERKNVMLSAVIDPSGAAAFQELEKFTGKPFDDAFLGRMLNSHRKSLAAFDTASKHAEDADLKLFVEKTLPTLRTHLEKVTKLMPTPGS